MNWGLIGASSIAENHMIGAIRSVPGYEVSTVLSSSTERGADFAKSHGIGVAVTSIEATLEDPEVRAVYISTTNEKHFPQAMAAIAAGKHVLCEKPLAMTVADAVKMVRAADAAGVAFATNHHLRNAGSHQKIKELIGSGVLGEILSIRVFHAVFLPEFLQGWRINNAAAGGGVIPDIVVHDADTVRYYLEEDPAEVTAIELSGAMGQGVEDSVMSMWSMPSGIMVQTHESFTHSYAGTGIEVHGSKGSVIARGVMTQRPVGEIELRTGSGVKQVSFSDHDLYARSMACFADAVRGAGQPAATGIDGVKSLAVAEAVKKAAVTGRRIAVNYQEIGR
jgi:1,5-anhydro-D-fructose reductase (1,5-anhydro-D-mannitol-forming)